MIRALGIVLASSALLFTGGTAALAEPQQSMGKIDWRPCPELAEVECGTLRLPIDWAKPHGAEFDLAVARRKATDPSRRIGAMLINPGGPGGSGVGFALDADKYFSPEISQRFDIIGFDPRGVARSQAVKCSVDVLQRRPSEYPKSPAEFDRLISYNKELRADCREQSGPIYDHVSTADVIQDMDAIRRSIGERKISYYGVSYGTIIGQHYAERYGDKIRAMVIDSNMDHSIGTRDFIASEARGAEALFTEFGKWSDRTPASALHGQDVKQVWLDLMAKADRGELTDPNVPEAANLTPEDLTLINVGVSYGPYWLDFAGWLDSLHTGVPLPGSSRAAAFGVETAHNPFAAVFCNDYNLRVKDWAEYTRLYDLEKRNAPLTRGSSIGHSSAVGCAGAPPATNPQRPLKIRDAPKILLTNSRYDPATAYEWAVTAHRQSRDTTVFVTYDGWGHGVYDRSGCTRSINDRYLVDLVLPPNGTRCAAVAPTGLTSLDAGRAPVAAGPWSR
jgi:pimeloyl-ACP methyl ester carboxylesterase